MYIQWNVLQINSPYTSQDKPYAIDDVSISVFMCDICEENILKSNDDKKQKYLYIECSDAIFIEAPLVSLLVLRWTYDICLLK